MASEPIGLGLFAALATLAVLASSCDNGFADGDAASMAKHKAIGGVAKVHNIVVIYAENRSFDNLYGTFPKANGIPGVNPSAVGPLVQQSDRTDSKPVLPRLPQTWGGVTAAGQYPVVTQAQSDNLPNAPFRIDTTFNLSEGVITRDLYHRFFENQMQIDGGSNDQFAAYGDAGGLTMGYYDGSTMAMWALARQFVLADNFFMGTFGGSFLNHQYLVCACAPEYADADVAVARPSIAILETDPAGHYSARLAPTLDSPASALDGPVSFAFSGNLAPKNYFGDGTFRAVNTMQPPFQPSDNAPSVGDARGVYADFASPTTMPAQAQPTIGDRLAAKGIDWKWYAGGWAAASANPATIYATGTTSFQAHHQPFNYFASFDPVTNAAARAAHLKDYEDLLADAAAGTLPPVAFYKPLGIMDQHAGYASVAVGDAHIAEVVAKLQASPQYANMVIIVTYDENGGFWDHAAPPKGDLLGPGTRIPAIIISPFARRGTVDHTLYDTGSVLRLITRRFGLEPLPGIAARDNALLASGGRPMGDLTNALKLD